MSQYLQARNALKRSLWGIGLMSLGLLFFYTGFVSVLPSAVVIALGTWLLWTAKPKKVG